MGYVIKKKVRYTASPTSPAVELPALFTEKGIVISYLRFIYSKRGKSQSWLERNCYAICLLLVFIDEKQGEYQSATELLSAFVDALHFGTVDGVNDPSGLFWRPRKSVDVNVLLGHVTSYCDFIDDVYGTQLPNINPLRKATTPEERIRWCAYYRWHSRVFLNHLNDPKERELNQVRKVQGPRVPMLLHAADVYQFPEDKIDSLISHGFEGDYGSQLIVMLMHFGGLRLSECFHIYVDDISIDSKDSAALISVFHPAEGATPAAGFKNRREYLSVRFNMSPRNEYPRGHRLHSGWKSPALSNKNFSFDVVFFPYSRAIEFTQILLRYLPLIKITEHPFLFTNYAGNPETKKNFIQKYNRALRRIGIMSEKSSGTSPHGHRHAYGYRLREHGFGQLDIQKAMHHKSPDSCLVYIRPSGEDVRTRMRGLGL